MKEPRQRYDPSKILLQVSRAVSSSLDLDRVSDLILEESSRALNADHASLFLIDDSIKRLILTKARGFSTDDLDNINLLGSWEIINEYVVNRREPLIVDDVRTTPAFKDKKLPFAEVTLPIHSFLAVPLEAESKIVGVLIVSNRRRPDNLFTKDDEELLQALSNNIAIALLNARLYHRLKNLFISTVTSLARAIDAKDAYTSGHSERVMKYAVAIGQEMEIDEETMENLRLASLLHDIGKIGVKESILMKPAKLLGYERKQIRLHPGIGARIIESIDDSHKIIRGVLEHHERFDGKGYPNHMKGSDISMEGRIIAVADTFDALTTDRPYQKGLSREEAYTKIKDASGSQFDPKVVIAFVKSFKDHHELWIK